jgi:hypothetical protein
MRIREEFYNHEEFKSQRFFSSRQKAQRLNRRIEMFIDDINKSFMTKKDKKEILKELKILNGSKNTEASAEG